MATRPTPGGSDGTWGTELNAHLAVSLAADGKIKDGAAQTTSAAPSADAELANKKYVDDEIVTNTETAITSGGLTGTLTASTASFSKVITHPGGMIELIGYEKEAGVRTIDISGASFTGIYTCQLTGFDTQTAADRAVYLNALILTQITFEIGSGATNLEGVFYHVIGY